MKLVRHLIALGVIACLAGAGVSVADAAKPKPKPQKNTAQACSAKANVHLTGAILETDEDELLVIVYESSPESYEGREITVTVDKATKYTVDDEPAGIDDLADDQDVEIDARTCKRPGFTKVKLVAAKVAATNSAGEGDGEEDSGGEDDGA